MVAMSILIEWAFRSSILILSGALLLRALRVKDPSIRLAAWAAILSGSLLIPALTAALRISSKYSCLWAERILHASRNSRHVRRQASAAPSRPMARQPLPRHSRCELTCLQCSS